MERHLRSSRGRGRRCPLPRRETGHRPGVLDSARRTGQRVRGWLRVLQLRCGLGCVRTEINLSPQRDWWTPTARDTVLAGLSEAVDPEKGDTLRVDPLTAERWTG